MLPETQISTLTRPDAVPTAAPASWAAEGAPEPALTRRDRVAELYRELGPFVYRRCLRLLKNAESASDMTQEVFVKLVRDIGKLEGRQSSLPWLYRVATNHCLNHLRQQRRGATDALEPAQHLEASDARHPRCPDRLLACAILSQFDVATRAIAVGVFVDGMEHDEVAEAVGVSRRTVARKLERFLAKARDLVDDEGAAQPEQRAD
jgi:RNA polymerase sigma-70 factor (ECF subfamily)